MLRLSRARRALIARDRSVSVAEIATRHGFTQLGRFSVEDREMFGQKPSETLRRAVREHERRKSAQSIVWHSELKRSAANSGQSVRAADYNAPNDQSKTRLVPKSHSR
jgi:AraC-like DNA-binding protein